jgi:hypothetical protein
VAGADEPEAQLVDKAGWYLSVGVPVVWIALPDSREVLVVTAQGTRRSAGAQLLPDHPDLPDLRVTAGDCFLQIAG